MLSKADIELEFSKTLKVTPEDLPRDLSSFQTARVLGVSYPTLVRWRDQNTGPPYFIYGEDQELMKDTRGGKINYPVLGLVQYKMKSLKNND